MAIYHLNTTSLDYNKYVDRWIANALMDEHIPYFAIPTEHKRYLTKQGSKVEAQVAQLMKISRLLERGEIGSDDLVMYWNSDILNANILDCLGLTNNYTLNTQDVWNVWHIQSTAYTNSYSDGKENYVLCRASYESSYLDAGMFILVAEHLLANGCEFGFKLMLDDEQLRFASASLMERAYGLTLEYPNLFEIFYNDTYEDYLGMLAGSFYSFIPYLSVHHKAPLEAATLEKPFICVDTQNYVNYGRTYNMEQGAATFNLAHTSAYRQQITPDTGMIQELSEQITQAYDRKSSVDLSALSEGVLPLNTEAKKLAKTILTLL